MAIRIQGGGKGDTANVTGDNRLEVDSMTNRTSHFASKDDGKAFNWTFVDPTSTAGDIVGYLKNTSTTDDLFIDLARVSAGNASVFKIHEVTGTASGTTVTGTNINLASGVSAEATAVGDGDISGLTQGNIITALRTPASTTTDIDFDGALILGADDAIGIEYDAGTTGGTEVFIRGYFRARTT